jgi:translation initiation factor 2 beta subunit (eIF-2beta)/eIF-5|tara:strand:- start:64 stop:183 length:120 start_codon:yes stop_codon:yes gene_type:complete
MDEIKPAHYVTCEECQEMIDDAIRKHNRSPLYEDDDEEN